MRKKSSSERNARSVWKHAIECSSEETNVVGISSGNGKNRRRHAFHKERTTNVPLQRAQGPLQPPTPAEDLKRRGLPLGASAFG